MSIKVTFEFATAQEAADFIASTVGEDNVPTARAEEAKPRRRGRPPKAEAAPAPAESAPAEETKAQPEVAVAGDVEDKPTIAKEELVNLASQVIQKVGSAAFRELLGRYKVSRLGELNEGAYNAFHAEMTGMLSGNDADSLI